MNSRHLFLAVSILVVGLVCTQDKVFAQCEGAGPIFPNVSWSFEDSVAACPAGDSLITEAFMRPSILRINLFYTDGSVCLNPQVDVPPESIWVTVTELSPGNLKINDHADKIFADDSTDALGSTTFRIRSFSGCGTIKLNFFVSGVAQGSETFTVRTTDTNADGRTTTSDATGACDLNYNGTPDELADRSFVQMHLDDWHRQALHGEPVLRTNLGSGIKGSGTDTWEPNDNRVAFSAFLGPNGECVIEMVPSDPKDGNDLDQLTHPPTFKHDYNPSWSPLGEMIFDRSDLEIWRKGVAGQSSDTSEVSITIAPSGKRVTEASVSPDGKTVVYTQIDTGLPAFRNLYTIPTIGGTPRQLTFGTTYSDRLPVWSPDGGWIIFGRNDLTTGIDSIYKVSATVDPPPAAILVFGDSVRKSRAPGISPDGAIVVAHVDLDGGTTGTTHTIDFTLSGPRPAVPNYLDFANTRQTYPKVSPDGTRLLFVTPPAGQAQPVQEIWAVRRNMSLPPVITDLGSKEIGEDTVVVHFDIQKSHLLTLALLSSDPEGDDITCSAFFLRDDLDMEFNSTTCTFTWRPKSPQVDSTFTVKFRVSTPSGGTDYVIAQITVTGTGGGGSDAGTAFERIPNLQNPSSGTFALATPSMPGVTARLKVYNIAGRLVAEAEGRAGSYLVWDGRGSSGMRVPSGVYLYQLEVGAIQKRGKWVLIR